MQSSLSKLTTPTSNPITPNQTFKPSQQQHRTINQNINRESNSSDKCLIPLNTCFERLDTSMDIVIEKAESLFYNSEYKKSMNILEE